MSRCCKKVLWEVVIAFDINFHHNTKHVSQADAVLQSIDRSILELQYILVWRVLLTVI
jgi:hypothetical protein